MLLYVNGDSHTAAAEAVNAHAFAEDDPELFYMGRAPHPENLAVSWGAIMAHALKAGFHCGAESASSNHRILRTTREWLSNNTGYDQDLLIIIQWSTWEREEWQDKTGTYYQVNASGIDHVPPDLQERYKNYVISVDWNQCTQHWHEEIWKFHQELLDQNIKHVFFNGNNDFSKIQNKYNWGINYIGPYDHKSTFNAQIRARGIETVAPDSWHFGREGHRFWSQFMLQYCINNKLI